MESVADGTAPLEQQLKSAAQQLGFTLVGITTPAAPRTFDTYKRWVRTGRHAAMGYLATERALRRREDPTMILPDCKSIIVTATPYLPEDQTALMEQADTRIAAYALGDDYHEVIIKRLELLIRSIETLVGHPIDHKIYTDTGPVMERDLAQRAGIGWIGKNTCLINPEHGSYFLLGEILLGLPLQADAAFEIDHCGTCTRCLEACPTGCILPDRTIDAGRCISYLTIEEKGAIDESLRTEIGDWMFGCDVCQQVCPWNLRFAQATEDPAFQPRPLLEKPDLSHFLKLKPGTWLNGLRHSPLERPRRKGLLRNAAVVAGNRADPANLAALIEVLSSDPEPLVRAHAAWALGQIDCAESVQALASALISENDRAVIDEIKSAQQSGDELPR